MLRICVICILAQVLACAEVTLACTDTLVPGAVGRGVITLVDQPSWSSFVAIPSVDGLELTDVGRPTQQTIIINGVRRREEQRLIAIRALREGTFIIPPLTVHLSDGSTVETGAATIVVGSGDASLVGEAVASVHFEPERAVIGQRVRMVYRLAFAEETLKIQTPGVEPPSGATIIETLDEQTGTAWAADGRRWYTETRSWILSFDAPASIEVGGQQAYWQCRMERTFGGNVWRTIGAARRIALLPGRLTVSDVPQDRPQDWTGLIGDAQITTALDRQRIVAGEGVRLNVTFSGPQVDRAKPPGAPQVAGIRTYPRDATVEDGQRSFAWDLVPEKAGSYLIPAISVSTFDPETSSFRRISSDPLTLDVLPGRNRGLAVVGAQGAVGNPELGAALVLPPPLMTTAFSPGPRHSAAVFVAAILAVSVLALLMRYLRQSPREHRGRSLAKALRNNDIDNAARILHALSHHDDSDIAQAARRCLNVVDAARFGSGVLTVDGEDRRRLESIA